MKKTITVFKTDGLSNDAANLYKFIATLCHCKGDGAIDFDGRDSDLFCRLYDCTDTEYLKAISELEMKGIIDCSESNFILHPSLYIFDEDLEQEHFEHNDY